MKVILLNQFFPPAQAPTGILLRDTAVALAQRGHTVIVLTSAAGYGATGAAPDLPENVSVVRLGATGHHGSRPRGKLRDYRDFYRAAARELQRQQPADALVCLTTPPFIGLLGAQWRRKSGLPFILWCMDLYPEVLTAHGWLSPWNPLQFILRRWARRERRGAAAVVALGLDMAARLRNTGAARVEMIPVWASTRLNPQVEAAARALRKTRGWADDEIVLLYSGNMGRAHSATEFAALAEHLRQVSPRCRFVFAGDGPARAAWARRWSDRFEFLPAVPGDAAAHLRAADVHLVSQKPAWQGIVVPSKFPAACAVGRPVVFAGPPQSAIGQWLGAADAGWLLNEPAPADLAAVARALRDPVQRTVKGQNALRLHQARFTPEDNCARLVALVEELARKNP